MDVAFVEHAEHDVDSHERGKNEDGLVGKRGLESGCGTLELRLETFGQAEFVLSFVDGIHRFTERFARREVE